MRREKIKGGGAREKGGATTGKRTRGMLARKGRAGETRLKEEGNTERVGRVGYGEGRYAEIREEAEGTEVALRQITAKNSWRVSRENIYTLHWGQIAWGLTHLK